jgi:coatomer subunit beta'
VRSEAPGAAARWKAALAAQGRPKIADGIADPSAQPELFTEGWEHALSLEKGARPAGNGHAADGTESEEEEE